MDVCFGGGSGKCHCAALRQSTGGEVQIVLGELVSIACVNDSLASRRRLSPRGGCRENTGRNGDTNAVHDLAVHQKRPGLPSQSATKSKVRFIVSPYSGLQGVNPCSAPSTAAKV